MESKDLVFDILHSLLSPVIILQNGGNGYSVLYANEVIQKLLVGEESTDLKLTDAFLDVMKSYENESSSDSFTLHNIEIFGKIFNINFSKNSNNIFMLFTEIDIEKLFENITFRDLSGACNAIVVVLDAEGKVVDANECFLNFVGMTKENVYAKNFFETFIPGDIEALNHYFEDLMSKESASQHFVTPMKGVKKEVYRINWQVSSIVKQNQNFIIAVGSDISKLVEKNNDLKRQIQSIKVGFDYFPFAIGYMNSEGVFTKMNPSFMKMFRIKDAKSKIEFDKIALFKNNIGFDKMSEHIKLIKEMSYNIEYKTEDNIINIKVDIRMLSGKKESSKFYIVVAQKVTL